MRRYFTFGSEFASKNLILFAASDPNDETKFHILDKLHAYDFKFRKLLAVSFLFSVTGF